MPNKPWWESLDEKIGRRKRKLMILKWVIIGLFAAGFFWFLVEMAKLGL